MSTTEAGKYINRADMFTLSQKRTLRNIVRELDLEIDTVADATFTSRFAALPHASYHFSTPAATANAAATPIKCAGTTTSQFMDGFTHANNRATLNAGQPSVHALVSATVSATKPAGTATVMTMYLYKNGVAIAGAVTDISYGANTDANVFALQAVTTLNATDYVELWCATVNADDVTVTKGTVSVQTLSLV